MVLFASATRSLRFLGRRDLSLVAASGVFLSLHFATFIFAVKETTGANATVVGNTSPVMRAVLCPLLLRERTTSREAVSVLVAIFGVLLVAHAGSDFRAFGVADLSALLSALFVALYSLIGRFQRTSGVSTACYTSYVYSVAALVAFLMVGALGARPFQWYGLQNVMAILGLALLPTTLGHSLYNYSLGSVKAVTANLFPLLEPVVASILAVPLFGEVPSPIQVVGYTIILVAVAIVATDLR